MTTFRVLTYRDLDIAHAFIRDAEDDIETEPADHPDFYKTTAYGCRRAALPHLSDREVLHFHEIEDALIAHIDAKAAGELDEGDDGWEDDTDVDLIDDEIFLDDDIDAIADRRFGSTDPAAPGTDADVVSAKALTVIERAERYAPTIGCSRDLHSDRRTDSPRESSARPDHSWKRQTPAPRQYARHA